MRLSADVLGMAEQRTNPLGERELVLRGLGIPVIEHLAATRDLFDAMDFADNRLMALGNFPRLLRLSSLSVTGNLLETIDATNLQKNLPNLKYLSLTDNRIRGLHQVTNIAKACPQLEQLTLNHNPVTQRQHYRLYVINKLPQLKVLDFIKVKQAERDRAKRLAQSAAGAALEGDVKLEARRSSKSDDDNKKEQTFYPGEGNSAQESFVTQFTSQQKIMIRTMIANATSPAEIERIEASVQKGIFPTTNNDVTTTTTPSTAADTTTIDPPENKTTITQTSSEEVENRKRKNNPTEDVPFKSDDSSAKRTHSSTTSSSK